MSMNDRFGLIYFIAILGLIVAMLAPAFAAKRAYKPGDEFQDCDDCPKMVVVPAGSFMMGSPKSEKKRVDDEGPRHKVRIPRAFAVGKFEVTVEEYLNCVRAGECDEPDWRERGSKTNVKTGSNKHYAELGRALTGKRHPIVGVSWEKANSYAEWLSGKTGKGYRLLSEAEWEYAARAGTTTTFSTGQRITTDQANFNGNWTYNGSSKGRWRKKTVSVGSFAKNAFGLHDLHGNVWEWVEDCYKDSYANAPKDGSARTTGSCYYRVLRGGSWNDGPRVLRSAIRTWDEPDIGYFSNGLRVARTLIP